MKKTKIIGTIGPASNNYQTLKKLVLAGLNVVRINLSHATREDMENIFNIVNKIREELNCSLPIMIDTRGPEIRVKTFKDGSVKLTRGQIFTFTGRDVEGTNEIVSFNIPEIVECIKPNQKILAVNGLITFKVLEVNGLDVKCKVLIPGVISNKKSLAIPGVKFTTPYLNDKDISDIEWGIKHGAEIIAASFVNCKEDVLELNLPHIGTDRKFNAIHLAFNDRFNFIFQRIRELIALSVKELDPVEFHRIVGSGNNHSGVYLVFPGEISHRRGRYHAYINRIGSHGANPGHQCIGQHISRNSGIAPYHNRWPVLILFCKNIGARLP